MPSTVDRVKEVMGSTFNLDPAAVPDDASIMETPGWDSVGHAQLMLALEETFDVTLDADAILELQSLDEIVQFLETRSR